MMGWINFLRFKRSDGVVVIAYKIGIILLLIVLACLVAFTFWGLGSFWGEVVKHAPTPFH